MISSIISRLMILLLGTLYPGYASYKAVRTSNVKETAKWMMYWIVFAFFTCAETFTDLLLSFWFPFYYEIKIVIVLWLLSPATKGSSILYRNFVQPALTKREQEIDEYISLAKKQGYQTMLHLGTSGVSYAAKVIMKREVANHPFGECEEDAFLKPLTYNKPSSLQERAYRARAMERAVVAETSDESRPSTPIPSSPRRTAEPQLTSFPGYNLRSRQIRSRNVM